MSTAEHVLPADAGTPALPTRPGTRRVVDAPTRLMHWLLALSFLGAYLTADGERWRLVHVTLGYTMAALLVARLLWGLAGPRQARLAGLWRRVQGLRGWLKSAVALDIDWRQGANLGLALGIVLLLALIAPLTLSGYGVYQEWTGDWLAEVHEWFGNAMLLLVLAHIVIVLAASLLRRRNLIMPMITGRAPGSGPDLARRGFGGLAALMLAGVLAFWSWQWQSAPSAVADDGGYAAQSPHGDDED